MKICFVGLLRILFNLDESLCILYCHLYPQCGCTVIHILPLHTLTLTTLTVQLLADEYSAMSPVSLEEASLTNTSHYHRINLLTHPASPEAAKKIAGNDDTL